MAKSEVQVQHLINQLVKLVEDTKVDEKIKLKKADYLLRLGARVDFDLFVKVADTTHPKNDTRSLNWVFEKHYEKMDCFGFEKK